MIPDAIKYICRQIHNTEYKMSTFEEDKILESPEIIILGVFGHNNKITETELYECVLNGILEELGRLPDKVLIPTEGNSSIYLQNWAESLKIPHQVFQADFRKHQKLAWILRDDRIQKECTHVLAFLGQKSDKLEKTAEKMAKKGKTVFTLPYHSRTLEQLVFEEQPKASEHARRSDTKIEQMWQKYQKTTKC